MPMDDEGPVLALSTALPPDDMLKLSAYVDAVRKVAYAKCAAMALAASCAVDGDSATIALESLADDIERLAEDSHG